MQFSKLAKDIFNDILRAGGKVYIVGGSLRDELLQIESSHDVDAEIYHLTYQQLHDILSQYGYVNTFGKTFAIMQLDCLKGYDFALPRQEKKIGTKHQDFEILVDPHLSLEKAIQRRDLTINALMYDYQDDIIIDLCGGVNDIHNKVIRCVNEETFIEDPLRVLRIAQIKARFEMSVDDKTFQLCQRMVQEHLLEHLSQERIYEEYCKILMAPKPSVGFEFLKDIDALPPYLKELTTTQQRKDYHPEGDVFTHTMLVLDVAALTKQKTDHPLWFMWSCLLHDIGKPSVTTKEGHAPMHNESGVEEFKKIRLISSKKQRQYIATMIMYHMHLMNMARNHAKDLTYLRLLKKIEGKVSMNDLIWISRCDKLGRGQVAYEQYDAFQVFINDKINRLGNKAKKACVDGNALLEAGFVQDKTLKDLLDEAYDLQLQGLDKERILRSLSKKYESRKNSH